MTQEEQILNLFDEYFKNTPKSEIEKDVKSISGLGTDGISFEDYVAVLNKVTSFSLIETGICDDIAYADLFNNSIRPIKMDEATQFTAVTNSIIIASELTYCNETARSVGENNYAMAA